MSYKNFGREVPHGSMGCGWAKAIRDCVQEQEDNPDGARKDFAVEVGSDWERKWKAEEETVFADGQACGGDEPWWYKRYYWCAGGDQRGFEGDL